MKKLAFPSLILLLTLVSCGAEQFGSTPASESQQTNGMTSTEKLSCAASTLIKPAVDIVYVVDNSDSTQALSDSIKNSIRQTVDLISKEFDYRVIGTPLLSTSANDYQVLASNPDTLPAGASGNKIFTSSQFNFFRTMGSGEEKGFSRVYDFMLAHKNGLLRTNAHTIAILVSNGIDNETTSYNPQAQIMLPNPTVFNDKKIKLLSLKAELGSIQFRFMTVVGHRACAGGTMDGSIYKDMSNQIYKDSKILVGTNLQSLSDNPTYEDSYDLCSSGFSNLFTAVNNSIQQVRLYHKYKYWAVTGSGVLDPNKLEVIKQSPVSGSSQLVQNTDWIYHANHAQVDSRVAPTSGEPISGKMIEFLPGKELSYPDCLVIKSQQFTEYFQYIVIARAAIASSVSIKVNGTVLPSSAYSYQGLVGAPINIKVPYNGSPDTPAVMKSGYMIKLNSPHYYKGGDSIDVYYLPDAI